MRFFSSISLIIQILAITTLARPRRQTQPQPPLTVDSLRGVQREIYDFYRPRVNSCVLALHPTWDSLASSEGNRAKSPLAACLLGYYQAYTAAQALLNLGPIDQERKLRFYYCHWSVLMQYLQGPDVTGLIKSDYLAQPIEQRQISLATEGFALGNTVISELGSGLSAWLARTRCSSEAINGPVPPVP
jgi:hypothetical protein